MEGDFSRGHRPDAKRGRTYRRVLARQGAALLDSDLHALMDISDRVDRQGLSHVACNGGSTDLGFFVTPGRLLAMFDPIMGQRFTSAGGASAARDYSRKYLNRLPGLAVAASAAGNVTVNLRGPALAAAACRVWMRAEQAITVTVAGANLNIPAGGDYTPFPVTLNGTQVVFPAVAQPYWVALIETVVPSGAQAQFNWCAGAFQIGGLITDARNAVWPDLAAPAGTVLLDASSGAAGTRWAAYLELSERVVTAIEDPGLREQALGSGRETTSRSELMAQVKLAPVTGLSVPADVTAAFDTLLLPTGSVTFGTSAGTAAADPCDLPVPGGYSGPDNRLYRLAVHEIVTVGPNQVTRFKWSRDNAGDIWTCTLMPDQPPGSNVTHVRVAASSPLRAGDLVELTSEAIERGDAAAAEVSGAGFRRPRRTQGRLFRLEGGTLVGSSREFQLLDSITETPVTPFNPAPFGAVGLKLRRWSGLVERTGNGAAQLTLEHGLIADVTGVFEPGDWWQAEARVLSPQANGPAVTQAHGPERLFAPLALFERAAQGTPLILRGWLDTRSRKLCSQEADFTTYDGQRVGAVADTVQEALDELFLRVSEGCGEIAIPLNAPAQAVFDTIPTNGNARVCLNAGTRNLATTLVIADKGDLIVSGIGPGTLLRSTPRQAIRFERCRSVDLRDFAVETLTGGAGGAIIDFVDCGEVRLDSVRVNGAGPAQPGSSAIRQVSSTARPTRLFSMKHCRLSLGMYDTGVTAADPGHAEIEDNDIQVRPDAFNFLASLTPGSETLHATASVLMDRIWFHAGDGGFDFVGSPVFDYTPPGPQVIARNGVVMANGVWGQRTMTFTTHGSLGSFLWDPLAEINQPPGGNQAPMGVMEDWLKDFRRRLVLRIFGIGSPGVTLPTPGGPPGADPLGPFLTLRDGLNTTNTRIHGRTGIVVAMTRGPERDESRPISALLNDTQGQRACIRSNRISGFAQGVRVGASSRQTRDECMFAQSVDVLDNHIVLQTPWQARQRGGIWVGNTLSVRVNGNRIIDAMAPVISGDGSYVGVDVDGIRLWGWFGTFVEARSNVIHGPSVGVRWNPIITGGSGQWSEYVVRAIIDNAYSGAGYPNLPFVA